MTKKRRIRLICVLHGLIASNVSYEQDNANQRSIKIDCTAVRDIVVGLITINARRVTTLLLRADGQGVAIAIQGQRAPKLVTSSGVRRLHVGLLVPGCPTSTEHVNSTAETGTVIGLITINARRVTILSQRDGH